MEEKDWKMIYRPHPLERLVDDKTFGNMRNILIMDFKNEESTQSILAITDMLLTDYSSIYVDYLALNRPICFLPYDLVQYDKERGLAIDFRKDVDTPGPKLNDMDDLIDYVKNVSLGDDKFREIRKAAQRNFYQYLDGDSCKRVWEFILKLVDKK